MEADTIASAIILGLVEGLTEFTAVSSTGHLRLLGEFFAVASPGAAFELAVRLGALAALLAVYGPRLFGAVRAAPSDPAARTFVAGWLAGSLAAAGASVLLQAAARDVLPWTAQAICTGLVLGGAALLIAVRRAPPPRFTDAARLPLRLAVLVGAAQCVALVPGVSRAAAAILAALVLRVEPRAAVDYALILAVPAMGGTLVAELLRHREALGAGELLSGGGALVVAVGFAMAFSAAFVVVRGLLGFVARYGLEPFAWWRIVVGVLGLAWLAY